jgi:hypothetical protein
MKFLGFLAFSVLSFSASASFQGTWSGKGILTHSNGRTENCSMWIEIEQSPTVFFVKKSIFACESMKISNRNPQPLDIRQGELWWGDSKLGTISQDLIQTALQSLDGRKQNYQLNLADARLLAYLDRVEWTLSYSTQLKGKLIRNP